MHELRIHGRGGQGAVLALKLLTKALIQEGKWAVGVPSFGFERRGAPVAAFLRFADDEIRMMTNIYDPDYVLCIDPSVADAVDILSGIQSGATLVQATKQPPESLDLPASIATVGVCDAVGIAIEVFGKPITNTVMLGAFARTTGLVSLPSIEVGLRDPTMFRDAGVEQNIEAVRRGYAETKVHQRGGVQ